MQELNNVIIILQEVLKNPWMLMFAALWVLGYMLKEHTNLNNKIIPWFIWVVAGVLGWLLIEASIAGVIIGFVIGWIIIGFYEHIKNTFEMFRKDNTGV
jgi:FtsH-binding integral membrane protein